MPEEIKKVKSIEILENLGPVSMLNVEFTDDRTAFMIASYGDVSQFIDQDVMVSFRKDMRNSQVVDYVNTLTQLSVVATLDKEENTKLFVLSMPDTGSNIIFTDLQLAEYRTNCIVFCDNLSVGSSSKATWVEFKVLDKKRNTAKMKVFNPENSDINGYQGKYLLCDIRKTNYGLSTQEVKVMENLKINANPEIELAKQFILNELKDDTTTLSEVLSIGLIDAMATYSDPDDKLETGYILVQTAMELAMASEFRNLSKDVDYKLMRKGFIANKLFVLTHNEMQSLSKEMQSVMKLTMTKLGGKKVIALIEDNPSKVMLENVLMRQVTATVKTLLENTKAEGLVLSSDKIWGGK